MELRLTSGAVTSGGPNLLDILGGSVASAQIHLDAILSFFNCFFNIFHLFARKHNPTFI